MPSIRLTDRWLLANRVAPRSEVYDQVTPGLLVRLGPSGPVFSFRYRSQGKYRRHPIGRYPEVSLVQAREEAREILRRLDRGQDPAGGDTFEGLCRLYMEQHAKRVKRSWKEDERQINAYLLPAFKGRAAADIRRREILDVLHGIATRAPIQANRVRALLSRLFRFALAREIIDASPVVGVPALAREVRRERVLSMEEIAALWRVLDSRHAIIAGAFRFLLLTGQRTSEARLARWEYVQGEWWTIPPEHAKTGRRHRVPLSSQALAILTAVGELDILSGGYVFPSPRRPGNPLSDTALSHIARELVEEMECEPWTPHDLRRTAASHMSALGTPRLVISRILNHADSGVTAIYDRHSYEPEMRKALDAWGAEVERKLAEAAHPA